MATSSILFAKPLELEVDIYSNKSALILFWLLIHHEELKVNGFSINHLAREVGLSLSLVHRVIKQLEYNGIIISKGFRTNKKFYLKLPNKLLLNWVNSYNLIKKTKTKGFSFNSSIDNIDFKHFLFIPALHTSAEEKFHLKNTNHRLKEYYLIDWGTLDQIVKKFDLQELDRGYELLLVKPYYSALIKKMTTKLDQRVWNSAYLLLTILDLIHFPLRGIEQAEILFRKSKVLSSICEWRDIENAIG